MIVKESAVSQKNNLMNKILLFLLGGCIIGSAITIFSAQNKQKKIPTQQNAESKQNTQQEDRISTISPNILLGFHLGMSKLEYNSLIKQYKNSGKMSIWDNNTYCMHWFETQNITVHDNSVGNFTSTQSFSIIFDIKVTLDRGSCQITHHGDQSSNCADQGILSHFSLCCCCINHSKKRRSRNASYSSLDGFLRA